MNVFRRPINSRNASPVSLRRTSSAIFAGMRRLWRGDCSTITAISSSQLVPLTTQRQRDTHLYRERAASFSSHNFSLTFRISLIASSLLMPANGERVWETICRILARCFLACLMFVFVMMSPLCLSLPHFKRGVKVI